MDTFVVEDEGETIDDIARSGVKIGCNAKVGGNVGYTTKVKVGTFRIS